jgi:hypothetical protein
MARYRKTRAKVAFSGFLAPKGDDGGFDFYVATNGRSDWLDLE